MQVHRTTVARCLDRLHSAGLIEERDGWHRTDLSLDEVADMLGATGTMDRQRARHRQERWSYEHFQRIKQQAAYDAWHREQEMTWVAEALPELLAALIRSDADPTVIQRTQWLIGHPDQVTPYLAGRDVGLSRLDLAAGTWASGPSTPARRRPSQSERARP